MTNRNGSQQSQSLELHRISQYALQGAGIALVMLITFLLFISEVGYGAWVFIHMMMVSLGGAFGGIYYYFMNDLRREGSWERGYADLSSLLVYAVSLWLSLIAALHMTGYWN